MACSYQLATKLYESLSSSGVALTYEISGRPDAVRPIRGERVSYTCTVEGQTLTWQSQAFQQVWLHTQAHTHTHIDTDTDTHTQTHTQTHIHTCMHT